MAFRKAKTSLASARPTRRVLELEALEERALLTTLYLAPNGNDSTGNGSLASPYATLARTLREAREGDTVILRGGSYTGGVSVGVPNLTIRSHPGERAVVSLPTNNENQDTVLRFRPEASGCRLQGVDIVGGYYYGLMFQTRFDWGPDSPKYGASRVIVEDCRIHDTGRDGIKITPLCDDIVIRNCEIYRSGRRDSSNAEGIDNVNGDRMIVQNCYIHDIATNGVYAKGGSIGSVFEGNLVVNCGGAGLLLGFYTDAEWFDTSVNPNYHENLDGTIRNNIIVGTQYAGIGLYAALNARVYNNTLVNVAQAGHGGLLISSSEIYFDDDPEPLVVPTRNATLHNNIISLGSTGARPVFEIRDEGLAGSLTLSHNRYFQASRDAVFADRRADFTGNLAQWQARIGGDANSTVGNPGLDSGYHLTATSPCLNAGIALTGLTRDYDGNPRSGPVDLGADEFGSGPAFAVPPPPGVVGTGSSNSPSPSVIQFSTSAFSQMENAGSLTVTLTRTGNTESSVSVGYATENISALAGVDYTATQGTLRFAPGETRKTLVVPILNDQLTEANETIRLRLSNPVDATLGTPNSALLTILDDEPPRIAFVLASSQGKEASSVARLEVALSRAANFPVSVRYTITGGTATRGSDYVLANGVLNFFPGQTRMTISARILNDTRREGNETFTVTLSSPIRGVLGANTRHTFTIVDDD